MNVPANLPALVLSLGSLLLLGGGASAGPQPFRITVVDAETERGVPLVELETVNSLEFITDSQGIVAFDEPGLMGTNVFFYVRSHGYEFPVDGFGYRGKALEVTPGGSARLTIRRVNIAERLYRVTGEGIYRDSLLVGEPVPLKAPLLAGQVLGSDSVVNSVYRGRLHWFWGDTNRPGYPLGNFHVPGATSKLPGRGGLDPQQGVDLSYYLDDTGFAKPTAKMPGEGPTWINGACVLGSGVREQMFAAYAKIKPPLTTYERGLIRWNDERHEFEHAVTFPLEAPLYPRGHTFRHAEDGTDYVYFSDPFPIIRVRAELAALADPAQYETFTCLEVGSRLEDPRIERTPEGKPRYAWKRNTAAVGPAEQEKLIEAGHLKRNEALLQLRERDTGARVQAHGGSVYWNEFRGRWVLVAVQLLGSSLLGEMWYSEAPSPVGPWVDAVKIVTHEQYSFYNPKQHPYFDQDGGRTIFFEGTYTHTFSGNPVQTPRYDYNQIMYKLDLADPRLVLPVPVSVNSKGLPALVDTDLPADVGSWRSISFFAMDRPGPGTTPIVVEPLGDERSRLRPAEAKEKARVVFHAMPAGTEPTESLVPLYEFVSETNGSRLYSTDAAQAQPGFARSSRPVCLVWRNPYAASRP